MKIKFAYRANIGKTFDFISNVMDASNGMGNGLFSFLFRFNKTHF